MNLIQRGAEWHGKKLKDAAGIEVTYSRKSGESASLTGTVSRLDYEVIESDGSVTLFTSYDWEFTTADLLFDSTAFTPRAGDRIAGTINGTAVAFEVVPIGKRPCTEWADTSGILTLVHTTKAPVDA